MEDIATKLNTLVDDMRYGRRAVTYRGGTISATAGFRELFDEVVSLPASSSIGTVVDESSSLLKIVPVDSTKYCYLKSLGGMTYKCNNLIPFPYFGNKGVGHTQTLNGLTFTVNEDRSVTINGTATGTTSYYILRNMPISAGTYSFSVKGISVIRALSSLIRKDTSAHVKNFTQANATSPATTFTVTADEAKECNLCLHFYIYADEVLNNVRIYPMLNSGSTALPYEPYYEGLRDTKPTAIKVSWAQLIPFPYFGNKGVGHTQTLNGLTFTVNEDRTVSINGTGTALVEYTLFQGFLPAGTYTMSGLNPSNNTAYYMQMRDKDSGSFYKNAATVDGSVNRGTFTITAEEANQYYCRLNIRVLNGVAFENVKVRPMLNKGSVAVPYTDYREPITYPIPEALQGTGKGVEGAADTIDFENGKKTIKTKTIALGDIKDWQSSSLGGSENMYITDDGITAAFSYSVKDFDASLRTKALCSHLPTHTDWSGKTYGVVLQPNQAGSYIKVSIKAADAGISTSDAYATIVSKITKWFSDNNVTLTYAIAEPTTEDIDTSEFDKLIEVEGGGSLEIITDNGMAVPTTFIYQTIV